MTEHDLTLLAIKDWQQPYSAATNSEHDALISEKTKVCEQYLLDLERSAFVELCMQKKTLERLQSLRTTRLVLPN